MKNIILLLVSVSLMTSCIETTTNNNNKIIEKESIIGYDVSDEGEKRDLKGGSIENIAIWVPKIGFQTNILIFGFP